jgi:hypothetical protein
MYRKKPFLDIAMVHSRAGSVTETETEKSVLRKTETETDVGVEKTEKNR